MMPEEIRLSCLQLALVGREDVSRIAVVQLAELFATFVMDGIDAAEAYDKRVKKMPLTLEQSQKRT